MLSIRFGSTLSGLGKPRPLFFSILHFHHKCINQIFHSDLANMQPEICFAFRKYRRYLHEYFINKLPLIVTIAFYCQTGRLAVQENSCRAGASPSVHSGGIIYIQLSRYTAQSRGRWRRTENALIPRQMFQQRKKRASAPLAGTTKQSFRTQSGTSQLSDRTRRRHHTYHGAVDGRPAPTRPAAPLARRRIFRQLRSPRCRCLGNAKLFLSSSIKISASRHLAWRLGSADRHDAHGLRCGNRRASLLSGANDRRLETDVEKRRRRRPPTVERSRDLRYVDGVCSTLDSYRWLAWFHLQTAVLA